MPLLNTFKSEGGDARAALDPRESLLALSPATVAYGVTTGPPGAEPDRDAVGRTVNRAVDAMSGGQQRKPGVVRRILTAPLALFGAGPSLEPGNFPESWVGGRTCEGPARSAARDVQQVVKNSDDTYAAVTDQRVVLLTRASSSDPMTVTWAAPRSVVTAVRRRPRLFARARYELRFTDGSWIVLSACPPHVGSWHAKQIVNALNG